MKDLIILQTPEIPEEFVTIEEGTDWTVEDVIKHAGELKAVCFTGGEELYLVKFPDTGAEFLSARELQIELSRRVR